MLKEKALWGIHYLIASFSPSLSYKRKKLGSHGREKLEVVVIVLLKWMVMTGDLNGGNCWSFKLDRGGVVMTGDLNPRLRWNADLHYKFVNVVGKLGVPDRLLVFKCFCLWLLDSSYGVAVLMR